MVRSSNYRDDISDIDLINQYLVLKITTLIRPVDDEAIVNYLQALMGNDRIYILFRHFSIEQNITFFLESGLLT